MSKYSPNDLLIRPYSSDDLSDNIKLLQEIKIYKQFDTELLKQMSEGIMENSNKVENFSILLKDGLTYCGNIELQKYDDEYSIGIRIKEQCQNKGIGTSAIQKFCEYCYYDRNIQRLIIRIAPKNRRSIHVFKKLGAKYTEQKPSPEIEMIYNKIDKPLKENIAHLFDVENYILELSDMINSKDINKSIEESL